MIATGEFAASLVRYSRHGHINSRLRHQGRVVASRAWLAFEWPRATMGNHRWSMKEAWECAILVLVLDLAMEFESSRHMRHHLLRLGPVIV